MDWTVIRTTLEEQFRALLPPPANGHEFEPRWQHDSNGNVSANMITGWKTFLRIQSVGDVATMRRYSANDINPGLLDENVVSQKTIIVEFRAEADYHDAGNSWAFNVTERVRSGLHLRSVRDAFLAVEMSLASIAETVDVSFPHDQRTVNAASMEATFNYADCFTLSDVDWFDKILLSSCVEDENGNLINGNFTDKQIPTP